MPTRPPVHRPREQVAAPRGKTAERGYGWRWQQYRLVFLAAHPLCVLCKGKGVRTAATVVDHITPHKGDEELFWDPENHQALCKPCHDAKTASEDGGFGNRAMVR